MAPSTWNAIYEVLLRHGIDHDPAKHAAMNELRGWDLRDIAQVFKRVKRPSREYCLFRTDLTEVPSESRTLDKQKGLLGKGYWSSLWRPARYWIAPPRNMMERAAKEKAALCVNSY